MTGTGTGSDPRISRRRAVGLVMAGAGAVAAGSVGWAGGLGTGAGRPVREAAGLLGPAGRPLVQPAVLAGRDGVLDVRLTAAAGVPLGGRETSALGYNGTSPGPTLRVRPGDLLRVRLVNRLATPTNLHTHGLHVSPEGNGDNPFVSVEPGASFDYAYRIPADHPAGTFWYHPHRHGYVADQVFGGLVGALLVETEPEVPVAQDRLLVVTDTTLDGSGQVVRAFPRDRMLGREGELVLVNGQPRPVLTAATGSLQRWRIVNGCTSRVLALRLTEHRWSQIAQDGVMLPAPVDRDRIVLAAGNRADVLVRPTAAGRYPLIAEPYPRTLMGMMGPMMGGWPASGPFTLATLVATGPTATPPPLPTALPAPAPPPGPVTARRELTLAMGAGMGMGGMSFTIDGRRFDAARDDQTVELGGTHEWTIGNISPMDHPFHLHVWRFQVVAASSGTPDTGDLRDVVTVPARGWVRIRIPFTDHPGRSVFHCHVFDHEDLGMMGTVAVRG